MDLSEKSPEQFITDHLCAETPAQVLIVGQLPLPILATSPPGLLVHRVASLDHAVQLELQHDELPRSLVLELNPRHSGFEQHVGAAVRAFTHRVIVHCTSAADNPGEADAAFFALGFRRLLIANHTADAAIVTRWFEYRLSQYKVAPDWLNARFWANPERFDTDTDLDEDDTETDDEE